MPALIVVALISGGKDSFFSILHCIANGHKVVALANLHPPQQTSGDVIEDLDSYMYQTVGHTIIPLYQKALGLPLFRQPIKGTALDQSKSYQPPTTGDSVDETESLTLLLQQVLSAHPEVNAVSTGAILSDYQRTRVEFVALRLGLTPLSYLWQWPSLPCHTPSSLLDDMSAIGQDSRIIKVASGGLDASFLWQNVADQRTIMRLKKAATLFGSEDDGAVIGEGGEYETLTVDGPAPLWRARILVARQEVVTGEAGSSSIIAHDATLENKEMSNTASPVVTVPSLLAAKFDQVLKLATGEGKFLHQQSDRLHPKPVDSGTEGSVSTPTILLQRLVGRGSTAAQQMQAIMELVSSQLSTLGHSLEQVAYTTIIMRDMADFPKINAVYGTYFPKPNPPARVTVACADILPTDCYLMVAMTSIALPDHKLRSALHVQSLSYWAPANIGPYSQAVAVPFKDLEQNTSASLVFIAGQIPLVPASMSLAQSPPGLSATELAYQAVLSLQHLDRIGNVMHVEQWVAVIAFVVVPESMDSIEAANAIRRIWNVFLRHSEEDDNTTENEDETSDFDVWDLQNGQRYVPWQSRSSISGAGKGVRSAEGGMAPVHVLRVDALPRGANIEWAGYGSSADGNATIDVPHMRHLLETFSGCEL